MSDQKKYAVIFPGAGYTKDRPLLYYAGKLAVYYGYEPVYIDFSDLKITKEKLQDQHQMEEILAQCLERTHSKLRDIDLGNAQKVFFISKSIGTVVAGAYAKLYNIPAEQIYFTPLKALDRFVEDGRGEAFFGDNDPFAKAVAVRAMCEAHNVRYHHFTGANHSLETGFPPDDIQIISEVMNVVTNALR